MATKKAVSRESILRARTAALRPLPYVHYELPADVLRRIEKLAFVKDSNDLAAKNRQALAWFREAI
ncbi:MAG: hypothetical protein E6K17_00230 [Methanobacteriota archaeon]|nr:MAG: hypothetical protein E6K17_00230 [Euryarchaeota archaeon]